MSSRASRDARSRGGPKKVSGLLTVRMLEEEIELVDAAASREGISMSAWVRRVITKALEEGGEA